MKMKVISTTIAATAMLMTQAAQADEVKGGAKADFNADELIVPCVQIEGYSAAADGTYFDLIFDRRGKSFNYELKFGEVEDTAMCEDIANYALFVDDDADDGEDDPEDNILASCEVTHVAEEQTAASISLKAKELEAGDYYAVVSSGEDNTLTSETKTIEEDEVEFEFSSNTDDVSDGAEAIEASFIVDKSVTAELFDGTDTLVMSETVSCIENMEEAEEEEEEEEEESSET